MNYSHQARDRFYKKAMRALRNSKRLPKRSHRKARMKWMREFRRCLMKSVRGLPCLRGELEEVDTDQVITIASVEMSGGACPYQIEATTADGKFFYLRYRHGYLRYGVWESSAHYNHRDYIFTKKLRDRVDGAAHHQEFGDILKGKVIFPEGFKFESFGNETL